MSQPSFIDADLAVQPSDSPDVRWALETAGSMWARGERAQALGWIQSAAKTAAAQGNHERARSISQVLARLEQGASAAAQPTPASTTQPTADEAPPVERVKSRKSVMQTAPYKIPPDEVTNMFTPDSELIQACQPPELHPRSITNPMLDVRELREQAKPSPEPAPKPSAQRPRPPTLAVDSLDATLTNVRPRPPVSRDAEHTVVMTADELPPSTAALSPHPATLGSVQAVLEPMHALRVAIASGEGRQIVLRRLDPGEQPGPGEQEAVLVPLPTEQPK